MNHLQQSTKLTHRTLVTQRFKSDNSFQLRLNRSVENLIRPFDQPNLMKFKKYRFQRKQTSMTMLIQTQQKMPKASLKASNKFNRSVIFEDEQTTNFKRLASPGTFHSLSLESRQQFIKSRSRQDIGTEKNRKKQSIFKDKSNDPILIGEAPSIKRAKLQVINQAGRQRQNGHRVKEQLIWEKVKPKTYLERFRAQRNIK